jgi:hypothetical protein
VSYVCIKPSEYFTFVTDWRVGDAKGSIVKFLILSGAANALGYLGTLAMLHNLTPESIIGTVYPFARLKSIITFLNRA